MLEEKIYQDYLEALKAKNRQKIDFLSFVRAEFKNIAIDLKKDKLSDEEVLAILKKEQKRLEDNRSSFNDSGRKDLLQGLEFELAILAQYLPKPLGDEELLGIIKEIIAQQGASSMKDMGKVMKKVLEKVGLEANAKQVSALVKAELT